MIWLRYLAEYELGSVVNWTMMAEYELDSLNRGCIDWSNLYKELQNRSEVSGDLEFLYFQFQTVQHIIILYAVIYKKITSENNSVVYRLQYNK